jgi:hypothetical protein
MDAAMDLSLEVLLADLRMLPAADAVFFDVAIGPSTLSGLPRWDASAVSKVFSISQGTTV